MKNIIQYPKSILLGLVTITLLSSAGNSFFELSKQLDIFGALFKEINSIYVDDVEPSKLMRSCIDGMLKQLDPYTVFYSEGQIENSRIDNNEKLTGIGIYFNVDKDKTVVTEVIKDLAADKAGIVPGDQILTIDSKATAGKAYEDISKVLKGEAGSELSLGILKIDGTKKEVSVKRQEFVETSVPFYGMLNNKVGLINLKIFNQNAGKDVKDAFEKLKKENPEMKGIILDLRGNPGGLLTEAVNIVNVFIEKNLLVVNTKGKIAEWNSTFKTMNDPSDTKMPIIVLTNSKSASASEIVSGALQDYDRGVVIGQKTYGKGLVQVTKNLSYGTGFKVTVAKYYIPSGRCIQAINYAERNPDGSVKKIPDSLKVAFKTANGRKVFDGGGVDPDFPLENIEQPTIVEELFKQRFIFNFASQYASKNAKIATPAVFSLTDKDFADFKNYVKANNFDYQSATEKTLEEIKKTTTEENYFDAIQPAYAEAIASLKKAKETDLDTHKSEIKQLLESEICNRYFYAHGKIEKAMQSDPWVKKAIELIDNNKLYKDLLSAKK